jgi:hypothetical protein
MENIKKAINDNRPKLSESSLNTYLTGIKRISELSNIVIKTPADLVNKHVDVLNYLSKMKPSSRKSRIAAIVAVIDTGDSADDDLKKVIKIYKDTMYADSEIVEERMKNQELTESQAENFISWDDIQKVFKVVKTQAFALMKKSSLKPAEFQKVQNYVILSLYTLIAPRRSQDYTNFKLRNYDTEKDNYMVIPTNKKHPARFVFNSYKNQRKLGRQEVEIPSVLKKVIMDWMKINENDYLLVNRKKAKLTVTRLSEILNDIFDSKVSTTLLRHSYLTSKFGDVDLNALETATTDMGNSEISRTLKYVSKRNGKKSTDDDE